MKKLVIFLVFLLLVSFQAFSAGSSEGISAGNSRNKTTATEEETVSEVGIVKPQEKTEEEVDYGEVFIVSQIIDEDLTLEILSYKKPENFFPDGVTFENKNQNNPLIEVQSLFPKREDYLNASLSRIKSEGGVLKVVKSNEKSRLSKNENTIFIFSQKDSFLIVLLQNSIIVQKSQEEIFDTILEWYSASW